VVDDDTLGSDESDITIVNGKSLNGKSLNGKSLNGKSLNGSSLGAFIEYVKFDNAKLDGRSVHDLRLEGSELVGTQRCRHGDDDDDEEDDDDDDDDRHGGDDCVRRGTDMVGLKLKARSDTGRTLKLRVAAVTPPAAGSDIWLYRVEYRETDHRYYPICLELATMVNHPAIPIAGYWNRDEGQPGDGGKIDHDDRFTFACPAIGALGKCVEVGYRPWASSGGVDLDHHHQACARLIRADYCGDGVSHTSDGALVNLYDDIGVQVDTESWDIEAEWDIHGARCLNPTNRRVDDVPCFPDIATAECALGFSDPDTLLISESLDSP
jgi:hypothetical protein